MTRYGDRNDVTVRLLRDSEGRISSVEDHLGRHVMGYTYSGSSDRITGLTDC